MVEEDQNVYYTHVPDWAGRQIEEYRQENELTKSKACSQIIQEGLTGPDDTTRIEELAQRVEELAATTAILTGIIYAFAILGQVIGWVAPSTQSYAAAITVVIGPSAMLTAMMAYLVLKSGVARKLGLQLSGISEPAPDR